MSGADLIGLERGVTRLGRPGVPGFREREKPLWMRAIEALDGTHQAASATAGEIHQDADVLPVHHAKQTRRTADVEHGRVASGIKPRPESPLMLGGGNTA